ITGASAGRPPSGRDDGCSERTNRRGKSLILSKSFTHRTGRLAEQRPAPVHHNARGDLVRGLQCKSTGLPRWRAPLSTQARPRELARNRALLRANGSERPGTSFQFTRRFSKRPRVPRTTRIAHTSSAADRSTLRGSLQERRRELPPGAHQRNKLHFSGTQPGASPAE